MRTTTTAYCDIMLEGHEKFELTNHYRKLEKIRVDRVHITPDKVTLSGYRYRIDGTEGHTRKSFEYLMLVSNDQFRQLEKSEAPTMLLMEIMRLLAKLKKFTEKVEN